MARNSENIAGAISAVNNIVSSQTEALAQIKTNLARKAAGASDISLGLTGAAVGDIVKVKAVDASGKPTEWEAVSDEYELIDDVTLEETVKTFTKTFAHNYKDLVCIINTKKYTGETLENYGAFWRLANGNGEDKINYLIGDFISYSTDFCLYFRAICHNADLFELLYSKTANIGVNPGGVYSNNVNIRANPGFAKISNFSEMSKIEIEGYQTPFQAGSRIVMWGIRA